MAEYVAALEREIALRAPAFANESVDTVFLGGGTPSILPPALMGEVLAALRRSYHILPEAEFTCEANPGALSEDMLAVLTASGVNRLSLGVQAAQPDLLRTLGRIHSFEQAREAIASARRHGLGNINVDLMSGLPGQTVADYLESIARVAELCVEHISAYSLIVEDGTPLAEHVADGTLTLPDPDLDADLCAAGRERLEALGYRRYEISNYAKPGFACLHNMGYWQGKYYLGLGLAAHSMLPAPDGSGASWLRRANPTDLNAYLTALGEDRLPDGADMPIFPPEAMFETLMLGLRTLAGVDKARYRQRFGQPVERRYGAQIRRLVTEGLAFDTPAALALTPRGLDMQNQALLQLMDVPYDA